MRKYPINLWNKQKELSSSFLILEQIIDAKNKQYEVQEKELVSNKGEGDALRRLLSKGLIIRNKGTSSYSNRLVWLYYPTQRGVNIYHRMRQRWLKEVKPKFINGQDV